MEVSTNAALPPPFDRSALRALMGAAVPLPVDNREHYRSELEDLLRRVVPPVGGRLKTKTAVPAPAGATPKLAYGSYRFLDRRALDERRCAVVGMQVGQLLDALERLSFYRDRIVGLPLPYGEIRTWWCLINLRLSELGLDCPGFRPNRRVSRRDGNAYTGDDTLLTNDRQMIDLHWLWESGAALTPKRKHRAIFESIIRFIQAMLGHAQLSTTEIYTQVSISKLKEIHAATHPGSSRR